MAAEAKDAPPFRRHRPVPPLLLAAADSACVLLAYAAAVLSIVPASGGMVELMLNHAGYLAVFLAVWLADGLDRRLWSTRRHAALAPYLVAVTKAVGDASVFCVVAGALFGGGTAELEFIVVFCLATLLFLLLFRVGVRLLAWQCHSLGFNLRRAVIVGANDRTEHLAEVLSARGRYGYHVVGIIEDDPDRVQSLTEFRLPYLGPISGLEAVLRNQAIDEVFVSLPVRSHYEMIQDIVRHCESRRLPVHLLAELFPLRIATSRLMHIDDVPLLSLSTIPEQHFMLGMKRLVDFTVASLLLLGLAPAFALVALLIKLDSPGPIFFGQVRVGQNQRRFQMLKFRSMVVDAEALKEKLAAQNEADGPVFKMRNDPRVTKIGRFIRKYSIDEFPQLINVWRGEMSLVGPRPPLPKEVEQYTWDQRRRLSVKPGMTGLWQVSGRNEVGFQEWVEMDLAYIDSWSLAQDFSILLRTFGAVVKGRGAS